MDKPSAALRHIRIFDWVTNLVRFIMPRNSFYFEATSDWGVVCWELRPSQAYTLLALAPIIPPIIIRAKLNSPMNRKMDRWSVVEIIREIIPSLRGKNNDNAIAISMMMTPQVIPSVTIGIFETSIIKSPMAPLTPKTLVEQHNKRLFHLAIVLRLSSL